MPIFEGLDPEPIKSVVVEQPALRQAPLPDPFGEAIDSIFRSTPGGTGGGSSGKQFTLKDIEIARRELDFRKSTGLRDIGQAREEGIQKAINNALQRGIFRSGITEENKALVGREADEAVSDLEQQIAFALERLKNREGAANAGVGGGGGGSFDSNLFDRLIGLIEAFGVVNPRGPAFPGTTSRALVDPRTIDTFRTL